jgi:hypothetical protein
MTGSLQAQRLGPQGCQVVRKLRSQAVLTLDTGGTRDNDKLCCQLA